MNRNGVTMRKNGLFRVFGTKDSSGTLLAQVAFEEERSTDTTVPADGQADPGKGKRKGGDGRQRERQEVIVQGPRKRARAVKGTRIFA